MSINFRQNGHRVPVLFFGSIWNAGLRSWNGHLAGMFSAILPPVGTEDDTTLLYLSSQDFLLFSKATIPGKVPSARKSSIAPPPVEMKPNLFSSLSSDMAARVSPPPTIE